MKEIITTGKTVDLAIEEGCAQLGVTREKAEFEIIDLPKKGFLGLKSYPAKVRVFVKEDDKAAAAVEYISGILKAMGAQDFTLDANAEGDTLRITLKGEDLGFVIGRRGETIDSIQYLTGLVINRLEGDYMRVTIDSGNFREKREKTLESLARRLARSAVKTGRSVTLEPMNPYERRIIHATVATVEGATSSSIGEEPNRRVVISSTNPVKRPAGKGGYKGGRSGKGGKGGYSKPRGGRRPQGEGSHSEEGESKPFVFRPGNGPKPEGSRRRGSRPERRSEENKAPVTPRTEVPRSEAPSEAQDVALYAKIDLE